MLASFHLRARYVIAAIIVGIVFAAIGIVASGALATDDTPVVAGVPLSARLSEPIPAYDSYAGWGTVTVARAQYSVPQAGSTGTATHSFAAQPAIPIKAWRWSDYQYRWSETKRFAGARVYIYPYATGWMWTWSSSTGWLAMRTQNLTIGYEYGVVAT